MAELIYIASPYSAATFAEMENRWEMIVDWIFAWDSEHPGENVLYSPIEKHHQLADACNLSPDWQYWWEVNELMLKKADEMWVIQMPGWEESRGITKEVEYWNQLVGRPPVRYIPYPEAGDAEESDKLA